LGNERQRDGEAGGYLGGGGEPSELEPRGGGGGGGGVAEQEGGLGEVELGGDGLHPPLVRGLGGVLEEADRGRVALERLRREGVHLRRPHSATSCLVQIERRLVQESAEQSSTDHGILDATLGHSCDDEYTGALCCRRRRLLLRQFCVLGSCSGGSLQVSLM